MAWHSIQWAVAHPNGALRYSQEEKAERHMWYSGSGSVTIAAPQPSVCSGGGGETSYWWWLAVSLGLMAAMLVVLPSCPYLRRRASASSQYRLHETERKTNLRRRFPCFEA